MNTLLVLSIVVIVLVLLVGVPVSIICIRKAACKDYQKRKGKSLYKGWIDLTLSVETQVFIDMDKYHIQFYSEPYRKWCDSEIDNPFMLMEKIAAGYLKYRYKLVLEG